MNETWLPEIKLLAQGKELLSATTRIQTQNSRSQDLNHCPILPTQQLSKSDAARLQQQEPQQGSGFAEEIHEYQMAGRVKMLFYNQKLKWEQEGISVDMKTRFLDF